ncbi:PspC domain-containing protein [Companilactobacillus sp.]|jgi:phage shock protein PspC (stress-responsive transcriptional regulator)|uniref:PspC domain-containing protein n=1 Tax=Companilactobacillus sp. TaxID=2767905 RepID=UPI0025BFC73D|nr:PspC domain-containing protein [Companilactobacillus sp.]MCH4008686.1 PspC domain-containing protein [Companilactobacillus sp.]MCH4051135.1 PspC domain-containing protein [Companilactobacillus sp.]MCH4076629.1 PspC domain-containing protein [Companilactobacillus sp.]MCH4125204.1 PspC domain-containing protein [Companilactobacillus sp.]MCH4131744.1 PspC domain-containing protein [Companilactobacillus sp.]
MHIPIKRSRTDIVFAGVIGGICEKYGWNTNLGRVIYVLLTLMPWFPGIIVYLIFWLLMEKAD